MNYSKILHKINILIFHESEGNSSLEEKLSIFCIVFSLINSFILIFMNKSFLSSYYLHLLSFLLLIITFSSTVLMFFKVNLKLLANISLVVLGLIYIPIIWILSEGIYGTVPLTMFMLIIFNATINTGLWRIIITTIQFVTITILLFYSYFYIDLSFSNSFELIFNVLSLFVATTLVVYFSTYQNRKANEKVIRANEKLQNANTEAQEAAKIQRELVSNLSHDLNTPITLISGYASAISEGLVKEENQKQYLELIEKKSIDLSNLIDDLIELSNLETAQIEMKFVTYNVHSLIEEVYYNFKDAILEKGLEFKVEELDSDLLYQNIHIDYKQINKVFSNLIYNSLKHTQEGHIFVKAKNNGDYVVFEIEDTGKGIEKKHLPYVFDRFYKGSASRNSEKSGSGLGLHIAKKIVSLHNGQIWATSVKGSGATFIFTLPLAKDI